MPIIFLFRIIPDESSLGEHVEPIIILRLKLGYGYVFVQIEKDWVNGTIAGLEFSFG
jgi:hypothetical protein